MSIVNLTKDSFYAGSRVINEEEMLSKVEIQINDGADIIDIGAMSTRPGALEIEEEEEQQKIGHAIEALRINFPEIIISVDTYRSNVAKVALNKGAHMINDISGGQFDKGMFSVLSKFRNVPYILMHNRAKSKVMENYTEYDDLVLELSYYFINTVNKLKTFGIHDVIIDPGIGFSKTAQQNFEIMKKMEVLKQIGFPILVGLSRKSFIYKSLNILPEESLSATSALHLYALGKGSNILRVHDAKEAKQSIILHQLLEEKSDVV